MNKSESKYYNTACLMDEAFILLLDKKDYEYITVKEICEKAGGKPFDVLSALRDDKRPAGRKRGVLTARIYGKNERRKRGRHREITRLPEDERRYVMAFYLNGLMAIIGEWIKCDCEDPIEKIVGVMQDCVQKLKK